MNTTIKRTRSELDLRVSPWGTFLSLYGGEVKLLASLIICGVILFAHKPSLKVINNITGSATFFGAPQEEVALRQSEKINVEAVVKEKMSYSYGDAQLGFFLDNLTFFDSNSKLAAEEKILAALPKVLSLRARSYVRAVFKLSESHQVDPIWILSVMWTESNFDYSAKSWAGARGLMQIMPGTRKFIYNEYKQQNKLFVEQVGFNINEYFPYRVTKASRETHILKLINIELGIIYLKRLLSAFKNHKHATVAYNMGPGWTRGRLRNKLPVGQKNEYLDKVRKAYKQIIRKI